jgi:hypothetical protein
MKSREHPQRINEGKCHFTNYRRGSGFTRQRFSAMVAPSETHYFISTYRPPWVNTSTRLITTKIRS